jgi:hypothetical protein
MSKFSLVLSALVLLVLIGCGGGGGGGSSSGGGLPKTIKLIPGETRGYLIDGDRIALLVEAGTVASDTLVTFTNPTGLPTDPQFVPGTAIAISNATLTKPVDLRIRYQASNIPGGVGEQQLRMVRLEGNAWVEVPGSTVDAEVNTVRADVSSFGTFGIRVRDSG